MGSFLRCVVGDFVPLKWYRRNCKEKMLDGGETVTCLVSLYSRTEELNNGTDDSSTCSALPIRRDCKTGTRQNWPARP